MRARCDHTAAWGLLKSEFAASGKAFDLRAAFAANPQRFSSFSQDAPHVFADLSKNLIDANTQSLLFDLARQCDVQQYRDAMFAGEAINSTENRAVMHTLLRNPPLDQYIQVQDAPDSIANTGLSTGGSEVEFTLNAMLAYAEKIRQDSAITDIVNIGIGGSDLGPQMAVLALDEFADKTKRFHFVSNVDGQELAGVLAKCKPHSTLFLIASKTFTTAETMLNAGSAKAWFAAQGGKDIGKHFAALTTNVAAAKAFGITTSFGFWDWVGGRYSLWSAIGLPIAMAIGAAGFRQFLAGAHAMDEHFRSAPLEQNLPVRLALLDVWYRNFHGFTSRSIAPYSYPLRRLPAYLQQLEMESNGKRVDAQGDLLPFDTAAVLWGEPGTNGQHAYFQMLHQGTSVVPVEFIAVKHVTNNLSGHHHKLLANVVAQALALMLGKPGDDGPPRGDEAPAGGSEPHQVGERRGVLLSGGHKHFPGNRPSTVLLLDVLSPTSLGALLALQEHRVFVSGAIWGINSFDQWGVELGKLLAQNIEPRLQSGDMTGLDGSTAGLLARLL
jgi:glucose-6-phosphate isomerase